MVGKIIIFVVLVLIIGSGFIIYRQQTLPSTLPKANNMPVPTSSPAIFDFNNQMITLNKEQLNFVNGSFQKTDPTNGQHSAIMSHQSVNPAKNRAAAILIDNPGGSGTFYYLVGAMTMAGMPDMYSVPVLLGDRIKIVSVSVDDPGAEDNGLIKVEYLDHAANTPLSDEPTKSVAKTYAFQQDGNLISVLHP